MECRRVFTSMDSACLGNVVNRTMLLPVVKGGSSAPCILHAHNTAKAIHVFMRTMNRVRILGVLRSPFARYRGMGAVDKLSRALLRFGRWFVVDSFMSTHRKSLLNAEAQKVDGESRRKSTGDSSAFLSLLLRVSAFKNDASVAENGLLSAHTPRHGGYKIGALLVRFVSLCFARTMTDIFTKAKRSAVMAAIRGKGNKATELRMIALLRAHGITGWRRQQKLRVEELRVERKGSRARRLVSVDFVFRSERVCVFVDGCFWHACPRHGTRPSGNRAFWKAKLDRNVARDRSVSRALRKAGWAVLRVWEHGLAPKHWPGVAGRVQRALDGRNPQPALS